jgi:drug/metabolite transporter (DMT)-like permease
MVSESEDSISDPLHLISSHSSEVVGYGIFTLFVSFITGALCWHFLDYAGRGPVQGEFRTVLAAYSLAVVGALSTMCQGLIVHLFAPQLTVMEALLWSSVVRFVLSAPFVIFDISKFSASAAAEDKEPLLRKEVKVEDVPAYHRYAMLALRGLMGTFGGHLALYWGVQFLLPSEGAALWSTAPFFALIFGFIILGEKLPMLTVAMIVFGFVGVLLVIQPMELVSWVWTGGLDMVQILCVANMGQRLKC